MPREALYPYEEIVERALAEDLRTGDATSRAVVPEGTRWRGAIVAREPIVACALDVAALVFTRLDTEVRIEMPAREGERLAKGAVLLRVAGDARALLAAERTALNILQRCCGIATATRTCVDAVAGLGVQILDTRKTAPGLRALDKRAVRAGGGTNHRTALDDMLLVKDNHLLAAGGLEAAVERALAGAGRLGVEIEVDSLAQLDRLLALPRLPHAVLLDNFTPDDVREGVARVAGRMYVEVSGNVTASTLRAYAEARPSGISIGALTHSVRAVDLALDFEADA
jgi:nicotinate-nucleotide pyrophosphorylase (carboxylating)